MIDYRVHLGALDAFREQLALADFDDPNVAALRDEHVTDADQQPGAGPARCGYRPPHLARVL
jgi:hypothetical protein